MDERCVDLFGMIWLDFALLEGGMLRVVLVLFAVWVGLNEGFSDVIKIYSECVWIYKRKRN